MLAHGRGHYSKACVLEIWLAKLKTTWHRIIWVKNIGQRQVRTHKYKISLLQKKSTKVTKKWPVNLFQYKKSPERMKSPLINYKIKAVNALNTVSFFLLWLQLIIYIETVWQGVRRVVETVYWVQTNKNVCFSFHLKFPSAPFYLKRCSMEAFIIVANISKLNGLDIKNSPGPFKIGLRPDIDWITRNWLEPATDTDFYTFCE